MQRPASALLALFATLSLGLSACSRPFNGKIYRSGDLAFSLAEVPSTWRSIDVTDTALAFRDDPARATVAISGRCGKDSDDVPLTALRRHLFLHFTDREVKGEERLKLDGREALRTELQARLDGVQKHFIVVVLKKDSCVYDFMGIFDGAPGASTEATFDRVVQGFSTEVP